jgi:dipeptidyl aminopeptidase/acylaminoacyl peptidase
MSQEDLDRPRGTNKLLIGLLAGCGVLVLLCAGAIGAGVYAVSRLLGPTTFPAQTEDYADARRSFHTQLTRKGPAPQPWQKEKPPPGVRVIDYPSGDLSLQAWVSPPPADASAKKPAVLFLHGGWAFDHTDWEQAQPFRDAGFVVMTPILRGENGQLGAFSMFYDEVDDVLAAAEALAKLPYVDADRLYVAGHSAGGTLTLLAALTSKRVRAAGAFSGSPDQVRFIHGREGEAPFDTTNSPELQMRSPLAFPKSFKCPVRLYYGSAEFFFAASSKKTAQLAKEAGLDVEAVEVPGDHFTSVPEAMRRCITFFQEH